MIFAGIIAAGLALGLGGSVLAQDSPAPAPAAAPAAAAPADQGPWTKLCTTDPASKKDFCVVTQEVHADTGQFIASAAIRQITGDTKLTLIAAVPPGVMIQPGLGVSIDSGKQSVVKYTICFPTACYGELDIDTDFVASMKNGKQLVLVARNQQDKNVAFPLTLGGFTKTFEGQGLNPTEAQAHQDELNKALQARAEAARKKLIEQQQKEAAPQ